MTVSTDSQRLVRLFDPSLVVTRELYPHLDSPVYVVRKNWDNYVFKGKACYKTRIDAETLALNLAEGLPGIPRLKRYYGIVENHVALLKQFVEGDTIQELNERGAARGLDVAELIQQIRGITYNLHKAGIARLDLNPSNVVISLDGKTATLIDLDICIFKNQSSKSLFEDMCRLDNDYIERLFVL